MSIADIVGLLNEIPSDLMFCKADTDLNANSVDDYIKGVMCRYVFTSQGNYKMTELIDKFSLVCNSSFNFLVPSMASNIVL